MTRAERVRPKKLAAWLVLLPVALTFQAAQAQSPEANRRNALSVQEIAKRNTPSVVTITTPGGTGSGVIVDTSGVIVTNLHVLRGQSSATVKLANGDVYDDISVIEVDERKDVVLIKIKAFGLAAAVLGNSDAVAVGSRVTVISSPRGLESTVSDGVLSASRDSGEGYRLFQTSAAASPGSSGGGMFNSAGELVGVVVSKLTSGENLNFAIPINYVRGLLSKEPKTTLADLAARYPSTTLAAGAAVTSAQNGPNNTAGASRLAALFPASGLRFTKPNESSWLVEYEGNNQKTIPVYALEDDALVVITSVVAKAPTLATPQMRRLLTLNYEADFGKLSLDDDGDLVALNEAETRLLDAEALKKLMEGVARIARDAAAELDNSGGAIESGPSLSSPTGAGLTTVDLIVGRSQIRYRAADWTSVTTSEAGRKQFSHSSGEVWTMTISERIEIPLDQLPGIGLTNAREADPKATVTRSGRRTVNGLTMLFQEWTATVNGIPVVYYAHYYSDTSGTYQLIGWTGRNVAAEMRPIVEAFVSGFQIRK